MDKCLKGGFSKEEKLRAYRLLTITYLYLDYPDKADKSYLKLLGLSPEYAPSPENDPAELVNHHKNFTTRPFLYLSLRAGPNFTKPSVLLEYSATAAGEGSKNYDMKGGFQFGAGIEYAFSRHIRLETGFYMSRKSYEVSNFQMDFYQTNIREVRSDWEIPLGLKVVLWESKISPFVIGGVTPQLLTRSTLTNLNGAYYRDIELSDQQPIKSSPDIRADELRRSINYSIFGGAGIHYKIGLNYLVFEARYAIGMYNAVDPEARHRQDIEGAKTLKFYPWLHVDDDFRLNSLMFNVGFVYPIYVPRKIKGR